MKRQLIYILAILATGYLTGCLKDNPNPGPVVESPLVNPQGNFSGTFTLIHLNPNTGNRDTSYANLFLYLTNGSNFQVAGDTSKIQAGSHGSYTVDGSIMTMTFTDATVTKRTLFNTPKKHLNGPFLYTFDGSNLHIYASNDTLNYSYQFQSF